jgi:DNA-binding transcriptional regulator YiaG
MADSAGFEAIVIDMLREIAQETLSELADNHKLASVNIEFNQIDAMTIPKFANMLGVSVGVVKGWSYGKNKKEEIELVVIGNHALVNMVHFRKFL